MEPPKKRVMSLAQGKQALKDMGFDSLADALDEIKRLRTLLAHPASLQPLPDPAAASPADATAAADGADEGGGIASGADSASGAAKGSDAAASAAGTNNDSKRGTDAADGLADDGYDGGGGGDDDMPVVGAPDPEAKEPFTMRSALSYEMELEQMRVEQLRLKEKLATFDTGEDDDEDDGSAGFAMGKRHSRGRRGGRKGGYASLTNQDDDEEVGGGGGRGMDGFGGGEMAPVDFGIEGLLRVPLWRMLLQRLPWLVALLLFQSSSAAIMDSVESILSEHIVLTLFVPMLVGSAGNAGIQPGVVMTRALGAGECKGVPRRRRRRGMRGRRRDSNARSGREES